MNESDARLNVITLDFCDEMAEDEQEEDEEDEENDKKDKIKAQKETKN